MRPTKGLVAFLLLLAFIFNLSFSIAKLYTVKNNNDFAVSNFTLFLSLSKAENVRVIDLNGNKLDFCYFDNLTLSCSQNVTDVIAVKINYIPPNSEYKFLVLNFDKNEATTPTKVFLKYVDFKSYFPDSYKYRSIDDQGGYCFYYGTQYYVQFNNVFDFTNNNDTIYNSLFLMRAASGTDSDLHVNYILGSSYYNMVVDLNTGTTSYSPGYLTVRYNKQVLNYPSGNIRTSTYNFGGKVATLKFYDNDWDNGGFCLKSMLIYKEYPNIEVEEKPPAIFEYTFNPICYVVNGNYNFTRVGCDSLPPNSDILIFNKDQDLSLFVKNFSYDLTKLLHVKITLNKLDEGAGYVKFVTSIENASFDYALAKVPVVSDVNKQLIKVTKNGEPYYVDRYYLTFKFNETDPVFVAYLDSGEKKEGLFEKLMEMILSLVRGG